MSQRFLCDPHHGAPQHGAPILRARPRSAQLHRARLFCVALFVGLVSACGVVPLPVGLSDPTAPPPLRAQDADFRTLVARWFGIWSRDSAAISDAEALFAPEADAQFFDGFAPLEGGFGSAGWSAASRQAARERFESFELVPREGVWLRRFGDRAIASAHFRATLRGKDGRQGETDGHSTLICERRAGSWVIVHEHTSFALLDEWLGGAPLPGELSTSEHVRARDADFQRLIDEYLSELAQSRFSGAVGADAPSRFFAPGVEVLVWDPTSRRPLISWSSVAAHRDAPDLRINLSNKSSRGDARVWKSGDLAWATFTFNARATRRDGARFEVIGRQTNVFQRISGAWRIVHEHASLPFSPEGTPGIPSELAIARSMPRPISGRTETHATAAPAPERAAPPVDFDERMREYCAAWSLQNGLYDEGRIARLYAPEALTTARTYADGAPWSIEFKRKVWAEVMTALTVTPGTNLVATRRGDVAWTTSTQTIDFLQRDGVQGQWRQFQTAVWEPRDGRWLIVSEHVSIEKL